VSEPLITRPVSEDLATTRAQEKRHRLIARLTWLAAGLDLPSLGDLVAEAERIRVETGTMRRTCSEPPT
jgi:hypothetical protein